MYHQFNIQQLYVLPTQCIYVMLSVLPANVMTPTLNEQ
jgi:hypothetical protein